MSRARARNGISFGGPAHPVNRRHAGSYTIYVISPHEAAAAVAPNLHVTRHVTAVMCHSSRHCRRTAVAECSESELPFATWGSE